MHFNTQQNLQPNLYLFQPSTKLYLNKAMPSFYQILLDFRVKNFVFFQYILWSIDYNNWNKNLPGLPSIQGSAFNH